MYAQRPDVGAVGAMLYYPDDRIQHAGVILGLGSVAGHAFYGVGRGEAGYMGKLLYAQDMSAVTGACLMVRRDVYEALNGLDEDFRIAFNDIDFCMRIRKAGYLIVWTPYAELYHREQASRGSDAVGVNRRRFRSEIRLFQEKWGEELAAGDPYYNPNLSLRESYAPDI